MDWGGEKSGKSLIEQARDDEALNQVGQQQWEFKGRNEIGANYCTIHKTDNRQGPSLLHMEVCSIFFNRQWEKNLKNNICIYYI